MGKSATFGKPSISQELARFTFVVPVETSPVHKTGCLSEPGLVSTGTSIPNSCIINEIDTFSKVAFYPPTVHIFRHWFLSEPGLVSTGTSKLNRSIFNEIDMFSKVAFWPIAKSGYFQDPRNGPNVPPETIVKSP